MPAEGRTTIPIRLSPLHARHERLGAQFELLEGWQIPQAYAQPDEEIRALHGGVGLVDLSAKGKILVRGQSTFELLSAAFGVPILQSGEVHPVEPQGLTIAVLLSDETLIITPPGGEGQIASQLQAGIERQDLFVTVLDQTSALAGVGVYGPLSTGVLEKLSALSFHPEDFPDGFVFQSSLAKIRATILPSTGSGHGSGHRRRDRRDTEGFEIYIDRSNGEYLWETLTDAGNEFDIQPVGWEALRQSAGGK